MTIFITGLSTFIFIKTKIFYFSSKFFTIDLTLLIESNFLLIRLLISALFTEANGLFEFKELFGILVLSTLKKYPFKT